MFALNGGYYIYILCIYTYYIYILYIHIIYTIHISTFYLFFHILFDDDFWREILNYILTCLKRKQSIFKTNLGLFKIYWRHLAIIFTEQITYFWMFCTYSIPNFFSGNVRCCGCLSYYTYSVAWAMWRMWAKSRWTRWACQGRFAFTSSRRPPPLYCLQGLCSLSSIFLVVFYRILLEVAM